LATGGAGLMTTASGDRGKTGGPLIQRAGHLAWAVPRHGLAAPTLIKHRPLPLRRLIGDISRIERVPLGLDLRKTKGSHPPSAQ